MRADPTRCSCSLLVAIAAAAALHAQDPPEDSRYLGEQFLAAFEDKNESAMLHLVQLRGPDLDPMLVTDRLLVAYRNARGPEKAPRQLAAAHRYVALVAEHRRDGGAIAELIAAWTDQDDAAMASRTAFRLRAHGLRLRMKDRHDLTALSDVEAMLASPIAREVYVVFLAYERAALLLRNFRVAEAEAGFVAAAELARGMGWPEYEQRSLYQLSLCARATGEPARAIAPLERIISMAHEHGDEHSVVRMTGNLTTVHGFLGDRGRWSALFEPTLAAATRLGQLGTVAQLLLDRAELENAMGVPELALHHAEAARAALQTLDRKNKLNDPGYLDVAASRIGSTLVGVGRIAEGIDLLEGADRGLARPEEEPDRRVDNWLALADAWLVLQRPDLARGYLDQALGLSRVIGNLDALARAQTRLLAPELANGSAPGPVMREILADMERRGAAEAALEQELRVVQAEHDKAQAAVTIKALDALIERATARSQRKLVLAARLLRAEALVDDGRFEAAAVEAAAAAGLARTQQNGDDEAKAWTTLAEAELRHGRHDVALDGAERAIAILRGLGGGLGEVAGLGLRRSVRAASDLGLAAVLRLHAANPTPALADRAFTLLESSRGLLLAAGLAPRLEATAPTADDLRSAEGFAQLRVRECQRALVSARGAEDPAAERSAAQALDAAFVDLQLASAKVQRAALAAGDIGLAEPLGALTFRQDLPDDLAVVHFETALDELLAIVTDRQQSRLVPLGAAAEIGNRTNAWRRLLADPEPTRGETERIAAAALGARILLPLLPLVKGKQRLWIAPDRMLATVPLEALLVGDPPRRLVETFEVGYAPSATVLAALRTRQHKNARGVGLLALGDPDYPEREPASPIVRAELRGFGELRRLPHSADEVRQIEALLPADLPAKQRKILLGAKATRAEVETALRVLEQRLAIAHFACHGFYDPRWGALSGLVLSGGEVLSAVEFARLRLPTDLLVLSACETAAGAEAAGEGVLGLLRGGFLAGSDRMVVSLWQVADTGTRDFMRAFYRELLQQGRSPTAALRAARLQGIAAGGDAARPFHWAGFVCCGVWD